MVSPEHEDPDDNKQQPVVVVNRKTKNVSYTGLFYFLSHFSKFIRPGMRRLDVQKLTVDKNIKMVVFMEEMNGKIVANIINRG